MQSLNVSILICLSFALHLEARVGIRDQAVIAAGSDSDNEVGKVAPLVPRDGASSFKVLQLADLHFGEFFGKDEGNSQDGRTLKAVAAVLDAERPDLVVFSGDQITGENVPLNADRKTLLGKLEEPLKKRGIPWATVFGNHDAWDKSSIVNFNEVGKLNSFQEVGKLSLVSSQKAVPSQEEVNQAHKDLFDCTLGHIDDIVKPSWDTKHNKGPCLNAAKKEGAGAAKVTEAAGAGATEGAGAAEGASAGAGAAKVTEDAAAKKEVGNDAKKEEVADKKAKTNDEQKEVKKDVAEKEATKTEKVGEKGDADQKVEKEVANQEVKKDDAAKEEPAKSETSKANEKSKEDATDRPTAVHAGMVILKAIDAEDKSGWRSDYLKYERAEKLSHTGAEGIFPSAGGGLSNYHLKVFASKSDADVDKPSYLLWFLDSGGGNLAEGLHDDQLDWLSKESASMDAKYGPLPGALYAHIPLQEYAHTDPSSSVCKGISDDRVTPLKSGARLFPLLSKMHVDFVFAGHNHGNDWCCRVQAGAASAFAAPGGAAKPSAPHDVQLCYGRHSGYGGYSTGGMHLRGARVLEFRPAFAKSFLRGQASEIGAKTWVRLEDGSKEHWSETSNP